MNIKASDVPRLMVLFCSCAAVFAQGTGTIHGTVTDPSGLGIPRARVTATLTERGTVRTTETDTQGAYLLPSLSIGAYSVTVEGQGFKTSQQQGIVLNANENVRVDAQVTLGSVAETVAVTAEAPLVDTRSSMTGALIDPRRVLELPINGRNVIGLATLLPGASQVNAPQTFTGDRSGSTVSMSGSRGNEVLYLFDGANFSAAFRNTGLSYPPPDALQEVKVLTNAFSAEYGRNAGSIFNVVTRSGANEIHGSLWEFLRNSDLNARNSSPSRIRSLSRISSAPQLAGPFARTSCSSSARMRACASGRRRSAHPDFHSRRPNAAAIFRPGARRFGIRSAVNLSEQSDPFQPHRHSGRLRLGASG